MFKIRRKQVIVNNGGTDINHRASEIITVLTTHECEILVEFWIH